MGLINLKTNLKSLKFQKDQIGGGYSGQPFVVTPIPENFSDIGKTGGFDFILRGGSLLPNRLINDGSRLSKLLLSGKSTQGLLFTLKQNILTRIGVKPGNQNTSKGFYNPVNTISQALGLPFGVHLNKQSNQIEYYKLTKGYTKDENNLVMLTQRLIDKKATDIFEHYISKYRGGPGSDLGVGYTVINFADKENQRTGRNAIQYDWKFRHNTLKLHCAPTGSSNNYSKLKSSPSNNGPVPIENLVKLNEYNNPNFPYKIYTSGTLDYDPIISASFNVEKSTSITGSFFTKLSEENVLRYGIKNYPRSYDVKSTIEPRTNLNSDKTYGKDQNLDSNTSWSTNVSSSAQGELIKTQFISNSDEREKNNENNTTSPITGSIIGPNHLSIDTIHVTNTVKNWENSKNRKLIKIAPKRSFDNINIPLYTSQNNAKDKYSNDTIPFFIKVYNNTDSSSDVFIRFKALIEGFSDSYTAQWDNFKYMGRGEDFYTYNGFTRQISFGFQTHAHNEVEMKDQYRKLNYLASTLTPDYSTAGFMRGNFVEITLGDYLNSVPGILTSLAYSLPDDSPWDILTPGIRLPHGVKVSNFAFTPIHKFIPKQSISQLGELPAGSNPLEKYISLGPTGEGYQR